MFMNDDPEDEEDDATTDILIGEGDDWPEDYSDGFDAPMKVIGEILLASDAWDLRASATLNAQLSKRLSTGRTVCDDLLANRDHRATPLSCPFSIVDKDSSEGFWTITPALRGWTNKPNAMKMQI